MNSRKPCHKTITNLNYTKRTHLIFQVAVVYLISCVTLHNTVVAHKKDKLPPGVNPSQYQSPPQHHQQEPVAQKGTLLYMPVF